jgi:hypothetical protein
MKVDGDRRIGEDDPIPSGYCNTPVMPTKIVQYTCLQRIWLVLVR